MLQNLADWLSGTSLSLSLQIVPWAIPTVQSVHILALAGVMGAAWLLDLRLMGLKVSAQPAASLAGRLLPWIWIALILLTFSGALLVIAEPAELLFSSVFQLKMLLLAVAVIVTLAKQRALGAPRLTTDAAAVPALGLRALALLSLALWVAIAFAGRLIAYI